MAKTERVPDDEVPDDALDALPRGTREALEALRRLHVEREDLDGTQAHSALQLLLKGTGMEGRSEDILAAWTPSESRDDEA